MDEWVLRNYEVASLWNACPSFHVASPWFLYRVLRHHVPGYHPVFLFLALSIMASTVFIRIHYLADIVGGILISELIFRVILSRLEGEGA
ncbi:MAG: phosphatase PAP2 family protein [Candidatus Electrothrix sp. AR4]|nr:phosphatase PAP2 family protein [Candidatus Electrothrix sp. AR4]